MSTEQPRPEPIIRAHRPGDIGWIIATHAEVYARDYGWDISFEALVAEIGAGFLRNFRPERETALIAERDGIRLGSAIVVEEDGVTAKLRLVIVTAEARGLGLGKRLVRDAIGFARQAGYARMTLWTNDILHAARAIYVAEGFTLVRQEPHHSFGQDLVGEYWELALDGPGPQPRP